VRAASRLRVLLLTLVACLWAVLCLPAQAQSGGQVSVSDSGTATYSYGLSVPPGIGGMNPQLGLVYSGSGINGPEGLGWSVQGISTITRCAGIVGTDGPRSGSSNLASYAVTFTGSDKLCLDGQRLIQTNATGMATAFPQTNDALGLSAGSCVEFRTEKDMYARILGCGTAGSSTANGPAYFKVWTKSGLIYEYGVASALAASNALIAAQGSTVIAVWAVSRVSDTVGNYMDFMYEQRTTAWGSGPATGPSAGLEWNLLEIQYTGNSTNGQKPTNKVVFTYTDRPVYAAGMAQDRSEAYHAGSKNVSIRLLQAITTYVNWTGGSAPASPQATPSGIPAAAATAGAVAVKTWTLTYTPGPVTNRSRLATIAECAGGPATSGALPTTCLPPAQFTYTAGGGEAYTDAPLFSLRTTPIQSVPTASSASGVFTGDFRGKGRQDLLVWKYPASNTLYYSNGDGSFTAAPTGSGAGQFNLGSQTMFDSLGCFYSMPADFNGDGLTDILRITNATDITGAACPGAGTLGSNVLYVSNGNGSFTSVNLPTSISFAQATMTATRICIKIDAVCSEYHDTWTYGANYFIGDFNGDGLLDIITSSIPAGSVIYEIGTGSAPPPPTSAPCYPSTVVCTHVYLGTVTGGTFSFTPVTSNLAHSAVYAPPAGKTTWMSMPQNVADLDGDGLSDLTGLSPAISALSLFFMNVYGLRSQGDGNFVAYSGAGGCPFPIDFNGDQRADCLWPAANPNGSANPLANGLYVSTGSLDAYTAAFNLNVTGDELYGLNTTYNAPNIDVVVGDFNGDGRGDILRWEENGTSNAIFLSNGDGTFRKSTLFPHTAADILATSSGSNGFVTGDFTGHGSLEILRTVAGPTGSSPAATNNRLYVKADPTPPDVLVSVTSPTGSVTTLGYSFLTNSGGRYVSDRGTASAPAAPVREIDVPIYVVTSLHEDTGVGATTAAGRDTEFAYASLRASNDGRGSLGYRNIQRQVVAPDGVGYPTVEYLTTSTDYLQSWPYTGSAWRSRTFRGALGSTTVPISEADYVYCEQSATPLSAATLSGIAAASCPSVTYTSASAACTPGSPHVLRPYLNQSSECGWDLGGTPSSPAKGPVLPTVTTTYAPWTAGTSPYTANGDPQVITVTTSGTTPFGAAQTFTKTTTNQYLADNTAPGFWLIGRLSSATVQNAVPSVGLGTSLKPSAGSGSTAQSGTATPLALTVSPASVSLTQTSSASFSAGTSLTLGSGPTPPFSFSWTQLSQSGPAISETGAATSTTISTSFTFAETLSAAAPSATATWQVTAVDAAGRTAVAQVPVTFNYQPPAPTLTIIPASTNWGTVGVISDSGDWLTVKNNSSVSILITAHAPVSAPAGVYSWQGAAGYCQPGITVLAAGGTCVTFFGTGGLAAPGSYTAVDQVSFQVQGSPSTTYTVQQSYSFSIATTTASSSGLSFGSQPAGTTSAAQSFNLTNNALNGGPLYITGITLTGAQASSFSMTHNCGASIAQGGSCSVAVQFSPTSAANFAASVQVQGGYDRMQAGVDSGYRPTTTGVNFTVPVSGTGAAPSVTSASFSPTTVSTGSTSTFTWATANATAATVTCTAPASGSGSGLSGSIAVTTSGTGTGTCTVTATDPAGLQASASASLTVNPAFSVTFSPPSGTNLGTAEYDYKGTCTLCCPDASYPLVINFTVTNGSGALGLTVNSGGSNMSMNESGSGTYSGAGWVKIWDNNTGTSGTHYPFDITITIGGVSARYTGSVVRLSSGSCG